MTEKEFIEKYCRLCGSQRCAGPEMDWDSSCPRYDKEVLGYPCGDCDLWHICRVEAYCVPYQEYVKKKYKINEGDNK